MYVKMAEKKLSLILFLTACFISAGVCATDTPSVTSKNRPITVRVRNTVGGPQIYVNDEVVPPRFFWGRTDKGGRIDAGQTWKDYSFEFKPDADVVGNGTLHFRFAKKPGEVWLADVRITEADTGADVLPPHAFAAQTAFDQTWKVWPNGAANTTGRLSFGDNALHLTLTAPQNGRWPDFHLHSCCALNFSRKKTYRCSFRAKVTPGQTLSPVLYRINSGVHTCIGTPEGPFLKEVALARDAGVNFVSFLVPSCWTQPGESPDWAPVDSLCRQVIAVNPNALLVPRIRCNAPDWWLKRHPNARMVYDGRTTGAVSCVSDRTYRADLCTHLEELSRHLCETFPSHFAGIHPNGQNTGEWFYQDAWEKPLSGYDTATRAAFREWLKQRGDPAWETAEPPSADVRRSHPNGFLRDPASERVLIEFARFQQREMADFVAALASACRRGTDGKKLVLFFYGYLFEFAPNQNGASASGHYALASLLKSKDIDILCAPISYYDRGWLGTASCMTVPESVMRAGILWLNEDDSRTYLDSRQQEHVMEGGLVDLRQTRQVMLRNTAQAALRGFGTWWMDLPGEGWFNDAAIWQEIVRLRPVDQAVSQRKRPFSPEIAAVLDEDSMCHLAAGSAPAASRLISMGRAAFGRCGAPYGQYLLQDVIDGKVPARLQVFLAAWRLTPEQRKALNAQRTDGFWKTLMNRLGLGYGPATTRVWCWAPGYLYPDRSDVKGIQEVTGFKAEAITLPSAECEPTELGRKHGLAQAWGPKTRIQPLFSVAAASSEVWAVYADGSPAVAVRQTRTGYNVFVGVPQLTPELVHALAKLAGVHLFTSPGPSLWAANGYLSVQAQTTGVMIIDTGWDGTVRDALSGAKIGEGPRVTLSMEQGDVRVLRYRMSGK